MWHVLKCHRKSFIQLMPIWSLSLSFCSSTVAFFPVLLSSISSTIHFWRHLHFFLFSVPSPPPPPPFCSPLEPQTIPHFFPSLHFSLLSSPLYISHPFLPLSPFLTPPFLSFYISFLFLSSSFRLSFVYGPSSPQRLLPTLVTLTGSMALPFSFQSIHSSSSITLIIPLGSPSQSVMTLANIDRQIQLQATNQREIIWDAYKEMSRVLLYTTRLKYKK